MTKLKLFNASDIRSAVQPLADQLPSMTRGKGAAVDVPVTIDEFGEAIRKLWAEAQQSFVAIGGYLDQAQRTLSPEEYGELCVRLPFGKSAKSQLLAAYRLIEAKKVPTGCEQAGYATVYLCATLTDDERQEAITTGVITPDMTRAGIVAFKQAKRNSLSNSGIAQRDDTTNRRRAEIVAEISRHESRLAELRDELARLP